MSEVKRYVCFYDTFMEAESQEDVNGEWVKYEDYARLHSQFANSEQENARLKADVNELADGLKLASEVGIKIADEVTRLKAEVERLRKAGDEMYMTLVDNNSHFEEVWRDKRIYAREAFQGWNHAKEGKQS